LPNDAPEGSRKTNNAKSQISRWKGVIKPRAEINEMNIKKTIHKINETKS
jgi:hypothetical protein